MSILSENVRIALFGMHQLQMQKAQLEAQRSQLMQQAADLGKELDDKNQLIASNEELLKQQQEQLDGKMKKSVPLKWTFNRPNGLATTRLVS